MAEEKSVYRGMRRPWTVAPAPDDGPGPWATASAGMSTRKRLAPQVTIRYAK